MPPGPRWRNMSPSPDRRSNLSSPWALDDVFPVVPKPAHSAGGGFDGLAARWSGLPGGAVIGDRRNGCERAGGFSDRPARPGSITRDCSVSMPNVVSASADHGCRVLPARRWRCNAIPRWLRNACAPAVPAPSVQGEARRSRRTSYGSSSRRANSVLILRRFDSHPARGFRTLERRSTALPDSRYTQC